MTWIEAIRGRSTIGNFVQTIDKRGSAGGWDARLLVDYLDINRIRYTGFDLSPTAIHRAREQEP